MFDKTPCDKQPCKARYTYSRLATGIAIVAFCIPLLAYVFASLSNNVSHLLIFVVAGIVTLVLSIIGGRTAAKRYACPLEELSTRAEKFAAGDFTVDFKIKEGPREVIHVAESLQAITRSTQTALSELRAEESRQVQFVSDVSHEIRTPLTGIRGNAETLLADDVPEEDQEHFLTTIISECDRLTRLANDLLVLQKIEATTDGMDLRRIDLRALIEKVCNMLEPLLEDRAINLSIGGEAPDVLGDADKLTQVMVNLIENASRFATANVHVELAGLKGQSVVTFSDDGPGFGAVDPSRLFDRFYRADKSRTSATGGTGLGLAIVKSIVTAHDGTVEAFNIPSGGACFVVAIPSVAPRAD
jgi:two-component system, OmpR family, sensor kinase